MKIVILGAGGRLGAALMREYREKLDITGFNHAQLDLTSLDEIRAKLGRLGFDVLINTAALTNVDLCEKEPDPARPISVYGESKRAGEEKVLAVDDKHLVVRVSWVFGPDRPSFVDGMIARARGDEQIAAVTDKFSTPTYTRDIAEMLQGIVAGVGDPGRTEMRPHDSKDAGVNDPGYSGILHFANGGGCSWQEYAQHALDCCHEFGVPLKARTVAPLKLSEMKNFIARRPVYTVLSTAKYASLAGRRPRPWRDAVADYVREFIRDKRLSRPML